MMNCNVITIFNIQHTSYSNSEEGRGQLGVVEFRVLGSGSLSEHEIQLSLKAGKTTKSSNSRVEQLIEATQRVD